MARFLEATLESVFSQDYPRIEYIVLDGGSTDGTVGILQHFARKAPQNVDFHWYSAPDHGTADALNRGLAQSTGTILAYLNADDLYTPSAIRLAVEALEANPSAAAVYGEADWISESGDILKRYPTRPFDADLLQSECFICQPACFFRRRAFDRFEESLRFAYDYDLWIRLAARGERFVHVSDVLARSRMHEANKTLGQRRGVLRENIEILRRHYGYAPFSHILAYTAFLIDGRDQFYEPFQPSIIKYSASLPVGLRFNATKPVRYVKEWLAPLRRTKYRR